MENDLFMKDYLKSDFTNIYHYCTMEALMKIVESKSLRFSNIKYLNDSTEFRDIIDIYKRICNLLREDFKTEFYEKVINDQFIEKLENFNQDFLICYEDYDKDNTNYSKYSSKKCEIFVCCFSLNSDSLNMWNYYSGINDGCNILFNNDIAFFDNKINSRILKSSMIYDDNEKEQIIKEILEHEYFIWEKNPSEYNLSSLADELNDIRIFFKNKAFVNESEFRIAIIIPEDKINSFHYSYYKRGNMLIPYIDINFNTDNFLDVTLGPLTKSELAKQSLEGFLNMNDLKDININESIIPLRY